MPHQPCFTPKSGPQSESKKNQKFILPGLSHRLKINGFLNKHLFHFRNCLCHWCIINVNIKKAVRLGRQQFSTCSILDVFVITARIWHENFDLKVYLLWRMWTTQDRIFFPFSELGYGSYAFNSRRVAYIFILTK